MMTRQVIILAVEYLLKCMNRFPSTSKETFRTFGCTTWRMGVGVHYKACGMYSTAMWIRTALSKRVLSLARDQRLQFRMAR